MEVFGGVLGWVEVFGCFGLGGAVFGWFPSVTSTFFVRLRRVEKCREMSRNVEKCRKMSSFVEVATGGGPY